MRIAQVVCAFPPYSGGIGNSAQQIEQLLAPHHEITNFTPQHLKPWLRYGHGAFLPQLIWRLRSFDYIYLHYPFFGTAEVIWFFKKIRPRTKLIIHYHMDVKNSNLLTKLLSGPSRLIRTALLNQAETIVSASLDYVKSSQIRNFYQAHPEKFTEVPFGIDLNAFQPKPINQPTTNKIVAKATALIHFINQKFIKKDRTNFIFIGALDRAHYFKGVDCLLRALADLKTDRWRLKIVGIGDLQDSYEKLSRKLNLDKQIEFAGKLDRETLARALQNSDLLILPSINRNEAFGIVLIEALACGVPVIASDLPGVRRVFEDHKQGLLIKPGDINDLREKLDFIINNEKIRQKMAQEARRLAENKYSLEQMRIKLNSLFR